MNNIFIPGRWSRTDLDRCLHESSMVPGIGQRIDFLSACFLKTPYKKYTLIGDAEADEVLVINLAGVDCFTLLDYVEAMRLSSFFDEFRENLIRTRYRSGIVSYSHRNHFFTDWRESNPDSIQDVTAQIAGDRTINVTKVLNKKEDGTFFLKGIQTAEREIRYIPSASFDNRVLGTLQTGDYAGIYAPIPGLDVSHAGVISRKADAVIFRHASSVCGEVVDEDFKKYIADKPGLVVLRPK